MKSKFGDKRLEKRYWNLQEALLEKPNSRLPQALPQWSKLKAAYRFFK